MTLIVSFSVGEYWFMLGDLLVSGDEREDHLLHLPSIGDATQVFPKGSGFVPTGLRRKVCQFSNIALAWAGNYVGARTIIRQLSDETQSNGPLTLERLVNKFNSLERSNRDQLEKGEVELLGYLIDPSDTRPYGFGANFSNLSSSILGNIRIAGSGSTTFKEYFEHHSENGLSFVEGADAGSFEAAVCTALVITGMLLQLEIGTYKTLLNYFGGGYELISYNRGRFLMSDDLMFAFWFAQVDSNGTTLSPYMKFFKQGYYQDVLIIRTLEMKSPDPTNPMFMTERVDEIHYFPPIYRDLDHQEMSALPKLDLNAFMLCSYILVQSERGIEVLTKFDWSKSREIPLRFVSEGGKMEMQIQGKYIGDIMSAIESRMASHDDGM